MTGFLSLNIGVGVILSTHIANLLLIPYLDNGMFGQNVINLQQNILYIAILLFSISIILLFSKYLALSILRSRVYKISTLIK